MASLYSHKSANIRKTFFLMLVFLVGVIVLGYVFAQVLQSPVILYAAVGLSLVMNFVGYYFSDRIALSMSGAHELKREDQPQLFRIIENLAITAGLPMPRVYIIPGAQINAFATGRNPANAAVAVTVGALEKLDKTELEGVLAHELSHIGNRDILISTIVVVLAGVISIMADWFLRMSFFGGFSSDDEDRGFNAATLLIGLLAAILAPLAATLIQLAVSRRREFLADTSGALLTRYPEGLAAALEKIAHDGRQMPTAHTATAHLFLANPFKGKEGTSWFVRLFMTHPPLEERIAILRSLKI